MKSSIFLRKAFIKKLQRGGDDVADYAFPWVGTLEKKKSGK